MKLRDAIARGANLVDGRTVHTFVAARREDDDGPVKVTACAMGAAWFGCHPDALPRPAPIEDIVEYEEMMGDWEAEVESAIEEWVNDLGDRGEQMLERIDDVFYRNDRQVPREQGWDHLLVALNQDGLGDLEVCDDPEGDCHESA